MMGGDTGRSRGSSVEPRRNPVGATPRSQRTPRGEPVGPVTKGTAPVSGATNKRETSAVSSASTAPTLPRRIPRGEEART